MDSSAGRNDGPKILAAPTSCRHIDVVSRISCHGLHVSSRKAWGMPRTAIQKATDNVVSVKLSNAHDKVGDLGGRLVDAIKKMERPGSELGAFAREVRDLANR